MVQSGVDAESPNIYSSVLVAARQKKYQVMITRLLGIGNSDLVAVEARYHRSKGCLISYTNPRNITAESEVVDQNIFKYTLVSLGQRYLTDILQNKAVFDLSWLRETYCELLEEAGIDSSSYTSQKLKHNLQASYPELAFISIKGGSDLICAQNITVGEVIQKTHKLVQVTN